MKISKLAVSVAVLLLSALRCQAFSQGSAVQQDSLARLWNGTVIKITITGQSYPFDHADYGVFIPGGVRRIRGILIHQHGCGMERFGITIPYDIQYQAFAKKWGLAVMEPVLYGNCGGWRDPESGSGQALLEALKRAATLSGHKELNSVPWLLWGHSGGGYWTLAMMKNFPDRILAVFGYSPAFDPQWPYPAEAAKIPLMIRYAGNNDCKSNGTSCRETAIHAFSKLRKMNAPVSIASNPDQNHNFSFVRYMALPFFESALLQRLPVRASREMRVLDNAVTWFGDTATFRVFRSDLFQGDREAACLFPDSASAAKWNEYVTTGTVSDKTPPPAPFDLCIDQVADSLVVKWKADADIESGIKYFEIFDDGKPAGRLPGKGSFQTFDTNGDNAIPKLVPEMKYTLIEKGKGRRVISVRVVNHFDLGSGQTAASFRVRASKKH
jgi:pimeloyl-ACP methyl ester carboxylesterase